MRGSLFTGKGYEVNAVELTETRTCSVKQRGGDKFPRSMIIRKEQLPAFKKLQDRVYPDNFSRLVNIL